MKLPKTVRVNGVLYHLVWRKPTENWVGKCDAPWRKGRKTIWIDKNLEAKDLLDTIIHEVAHATNWNIDEEHIAAAATAAAELAWKVGFRLE